MSEETPIHLEPRPIPSLAEVLFPHLVRPVIFDYDSVPKFVTDMLAWRRRADRNFSVSTAIASLPNCSAPLVSQVAKGFRSLTRDRVEAFATLLGLSAQEAKYFDQWVAITRAGGASTIPVKSSKKKLPSLRRPTRRPQNSIVSDWLHPYVKETCKLNGGQLPEPSEIHRILGGIASLKQIEKSVEFLIREGFLRRTIEGQFVVSDLVTVTTDEVPDTKVRDFHLKGLQITRRGFDLYPPNQRRSETYVLSVNERNLPKLKKILTDCMDQIEQFEHDHPVDNERIYQVSLHLTPVGGGRKAHHELS